MKNLNKMKWSVVLSVVIIVLLLAMLSISFVHTKNQDKVIASQENTIDAYVVEITTLSPIEKIELNVESLKIDADNFTVARDEHQAIVDENQWLVDAYDHNRKTAIWATRCWEQNAVLLMQDKDLDECNDNLERFASYNLGK